MAEPPRILVLAGVNGAGKSSIFGALLRAKGSAWYDPDAAASLAREQQPSLTPEEANAWAWNEGLRLLDAAIAGGVDFQFETTLGGRTLTARLETALQAGHEVFMFYVGLESVELHLQRVRERVARGGHAIPEGKIRERYDTSRENLVRLIPKLTALRVFDNSREGPPGEGAEPRLREILRVERGVSTLPCGMDQVPDWAKPLVAAALRGPRR